MSYALSWSIIVHDFTMSELEIYARQGLGQQLEPGARPALVLVDFVNGFVDPAHLGGGNVPQAVQCTVPLLAYARSKGWPVAFTRVVYADDGSDLGVFAAKGAALKTLTETSPISQIVDELAAEPGEFIIRKRQASAFFNTDLAPWLTFKGVDTALIVGATTSGCVRASVVDACSHNFRPIVVTDCVGDRAIGPHEASLFDMDQKYARLMSSAEVMAHYA
jgi:maleamate amidohydrolase